VRDVYVAPTVTVVLLLLLLLLHGGETFGEGVRVPSTFWSGLLYHHFPDVWQKKVVGKGDGAAV